ncbi:hypothetical protein BD324DRAFT_584918 [Kockovaella imperatae]|uniref:polynucleotide adenylyltransferase n=1 Tax=Kockovaella imperatae TaxID=4999 RepID=A0A1Y1U6E7_9TREE|nr:hypothetical protein BD324DRAFT_584918 [Kockovaella imperatae]ORX33588.1 hypothetical protein BD324DRAFT_584918 [Kockovaella imperatae]
MTAPVAADGAAAGNFTSNADYIAFDSPSPSLAGPSRPASRSSSPRLTSADPKSKKRKAGAEDTSSSTPSSKQKDKRGKKKDNSESAKKDKGKGKANDSNGVSREPPTGPRNLKEERRAAERGCPWVTLVDWENCNDPAEILNSEIQAFYQYMSPTRVEYEVRLCIIELISRTVKRTWPEAEVHPFGSWQTQLYLPSGDIDLVVTTNRLTVSNKAKLLAELARAMRMAYLTDVVAIISKARVPIIKFVTTQGSLNVDISLNQTNGINAGMIINKYLEILPGARQLIVVVKAFLSQRSMNEVYTGGLGSYSVICLVISFLQVHPKLRRSEIDPEKNLGTLLIEFFELYGRNFNYEDVGLSIRRGGFYYSKQSRGWYKAQQPFTLSIEDPQDKDNNISVGSYGIRQVRATLAGAFEMLQAKLFERAENMYSRENGAGLRKSEPEDMSILSGIMGVTKEVNTSSPAM